MKKLSISSKLKIVSATLAIIAVLTVSPTLAYLSAATDPVVNYFSGGAIAIKLDEAPVDADGKEIDGDRVQENHYKYMAGAELDKDPTVTVLADSEDCYVYVCVDNELPSDLFSININTGVWTWVAASGTMTIYRYVDVVDSSESDQALVPVFTTVTVSESLTSDDIANLGSRTLTVTAFAIQTASLTADEADDLAEAYFFEGADVASFEAEETAGSTANTEAVQEKGAATETVSGEETIETETAKENVSTVEASETGTTEETASGEEMTETEAAEEAVSGEETAEIDASEETASAEETAETEASEETAPAEEISATETAEEIVSTEEASSTETTEEAASAEETTATEAAEETVSGEEAAETEEAEEITSAEETSETAAGASEASESEESASKAETEQGSEGVTDSESE